MSMRRIAALFLTLSLTAAPLAAQEAESDDNGGLMKRGAEMFMQGLMDELDPALRELEGMARDMEPALRSFRDEMGPALVQLMEKVEDWSKYDPPEMLPNGDIILRRKAPFAPEPEDDPPLRDVPRGEGPEIEL